MRVLRTIVLAIVLVASLTALAPATSAQAHPYGRTVHESRHHWYNGAGMVAVTLKLENYRYRRTIYTCKITLFNRGGRVLDRRYKRFRLDARSWRYGNMYAYWDPSTEWGYEYRWVCREGWSV